MSDCDSDSSYDYPGPGALEAQLRSILQEIKSVKKNTKGLNSHLKHLYKKVYLIKEEFKRRQHKKNPCLRNILEQLKRKMFIGDDQFKELIRHSYLVDSFNKNITLKESEIYEVDAYPTAVLKFATLLHYYTPRGYKYAMRTFKTNLPPPDVLMSQESSKYARESLAHYVSKILNGPQGQRTIKVLCFAGWDAPSDDIVATEPYIFTYVSKTHVYRKHIPFTGTDPNKITS